MQEIIIFIITSSLIIILVELFTYLRKGNKKRKIQKDKDKDKYKDDKNKTDINFTINKDTELTRSLLNKYSTNSDIQVEHLPGKFYIENPDNIFIKIKDRIIIPEHKIIYNLEEKFTLDIINLKKEKIFYYYK